MNKEEYHKEYREQHLVESHLRNINHWRTQKLVRDIYFLSDNDNTYFCFTIKKAQKIIKTDWYSCKNLMEGKIKSVNGFTCEKYTYDLVNPENNKEVVKMYARCDLGNDYTEHDFQVYFKAYCNILHLFLENSIKSNLEKTHIVLKKKYIVSNSEENIEFSTLKDTAKFLGCSPYYVKELLESGEECNGYTVDVI